NYGLPNTNNKLEGTFTDLKKNLNNHSGMSKENRKRFIDGFFKVRHKETSLRIIIKSALKNTLYNTH
nr:hypothetical protein [Paludibacteraceae bacterium]